MTFTSANLDIFGRSVGELFSCFFSEKQDGISLNGGDSTLFIDSYLFIDAFSNKKWVLVAGGVFR
ncbi:hypothetical protein ACERII_21985 [Evansella sp. AB-rgal1]|uniref:hypothetical protein n=1 Tax=Evansella sp. AB-rgal1 TaxID=3242696 RepID=UPI00359E692E